MTGPIKVQLFETKPANRRWTSREFEWELWAAKAFCRPPTYFTQDKPTYPYCVPEPLVNFDLNFNKGQH